MGQDAGVFVGVRVGVSIWLGLAEGEARVVRFLGWGTRRSLGVGKALGGGGSLEFGVEVGGDLGLTGEDPEGFVVRGADESPVEGGVGGEDPVGAVEKEEVRGFQLAVPGFALFSGEIHVGLIAAFDGAEGAGLEGGGFVAEGIEDGVVGKGTFSRISRGGGQFRTRCR